MRQPTGAWAAGAIVSTVNDVARFYNALLGGRLLHPAQLAAMENTVRTADGDGYGLGLLALRTACGRVFGHDGDFPGYATEAFTSTEQATATHPVHQLRPVHKPNQQSDHRDVERRPLWTPALVGIRSRLDALGACCANVSPCG